MTESISVLVVDDEPDILETLEYSLGRKGYEVATAADGLEGLEEHPMGRCRGKEEERI